MYSDGTEWAEGEVRSKAAERKGNRPMAAAYAAGMPRQSPPQHVGSRLGRPGLNTFERRALAPLRKGLGIDAELSAQLREPSDPPLNRRRAGLRLAIIRGSPRTSGGQPLIITARTACMVVALP